MIMSIIRSSRNPRLPQLQPLSAQYNLIQKKLVTRRYIGQWAWFIAFAGWSCLLSLLGDEYIDVYSSTTAWWLLDLTILLAYIGYAVLPPCCAVGPQIPTKCALACFVALADPTHVDRQGKMLKKSMSWLLGVGLYFTLKKTFPVFADALSLKIVDGGILDLGLILAFTFCAASNNNLAPTILSPADWCLLVGAKKPPMSWPFHVSRRPHGIRDWHHCRLLPRHLLARAFPPACERAGALSTEHRGAAREPVRIRGPRTGEEHGQKPPTAGLQAHRGGRVDVEAGVLL